MATDVLGVRETVEQALAAVGAQLAKPLEIDEVRDGYRAVLKDGREVFVSWEEAALLSKALGRLRFSVR